MTTLLFTHPDCAGHQTPEGHPESSARLSAVRAALSEPDSPDLSAGTHRWPRKQHWRASMARPSSAAFWARCPKRACARLMPIPSCRPVREGGAACGGRRDLGGGRRGDGEGPMPSAPSGRPVIMRNRATPWASACSTPWRWPHAMRRPCIGSAAWRSSISMSITATAPRRWRKQDPTLFFAPPATNIRFIPAPDRPGKPGWAMSSMSRCRPGTGAVDISAALGRDANHARA